MSDKSDKGGGGRIDGETWDAAITPHASYCPDSIFLHASPRQQEQESKPLGRRLLSGGQRSIKDHLYLQSSGDHIIVLLLSLFSWLTLIFLWQTSRNVKSSAAAWCSLHIGTKKRKKNPNQTLTLTKNKASCLQHLLSASTEASNKSTARTVKH